MQAAPGSAGVGSHLDALAAAGVVELSGASDGAEYRLADPELATACASLRSVLVCRIATARRLDEFAVPDRWAHHGR